MTEEILTTKPEHITDTDCIELSSNPELKKRYEKKWGVIGVCEVDQGNQD